MLPAVFAGFRAHRRAWWRMACAAALFASADAGAQTLNVRVTDADNGSLLGGASVRVTDAAGTVVSSGFTEPDGRVALRLPAGGEHTVRVERTGYQPGSRTVTVSATGRASADIRLSPRALVIDTLVVIARLRNQRGRDAFARRRAAGTGSFLDSAYLEPRKRGAVWVSSLVYGVPGITIRPIGPRRTPTATSDRSYGCMVHLVDGAVARRSARPKDVVAVEVYPTHMDVPIELRQLAWIDRGTQREPRPESCGAIVYWTRMGW